MQTNSQSSWQRWHTMSIPRRLATLVPPLCIVGAATTAVWYAPTIAAKAAGVGAGLLAVQAAYDHYTGHSHRDIVVITAAMAAASTIIPLALASPGWQIGILTVLIAGSPLGYGIRYWPSQIVGENIFHVTFAAAVISPVLLFLLLLAVMPVTVTGFSSMYIASLCRWRC